MDAIRFEPPPSGPARTFYRINAGDWINVVPLTAERDVVMIRQYRFGVEDFTLEIPGGMCDPGESPLEAARRELREETGCEARELVELGWVHPNPAIQVNRCFTFLAKDVVRVGAPQPDANEAFEQVTVSLDDVPRLIGERKITHALVVAAFGLLQVRRESGS